MALLSMHNMLKTDVKTGVKRDLCTICVLISLACKRNLAIFAAEIILTTQTPIHHETTISTRELLLGSYHYRNGSDRYQRYGNRQDQRHTAGVCQRGGIYHRRHHLYNRCHHRQPGALQAERPTVACSHQGVDDRLHHTHRP